MGCPYELRPDMLVPDIAFCILKNRGKAVHFKELITEIMSVKAINQENPGRLIAQMHTEINLDSRFIHQGNGEWGLREWLPKGSKVLKIRPEATAPPKRSRTVIRAEEDDDYDSEDEESNDESEDGYGSDQEDYDEDED